VALVVVHLTLALVVAVPVVGRAVVVAMALLWRLLVDFPGMVGTHLLVLTEILLVVVVEFLGVNVALGCSVLRTSSLHLASSLILDSSDRHHLHHLYLLFVLLSRVFQ
jgi:hypothetical protein